VTKKKKKKKKPFALLNLVRETRREKRGKRRSSLLEWKEKIKKTVYDDGEAEEGKTTLKKIKMMITMLMLTMIQTRNWKDREEKDHRWRILSCVFFGFCGRT